MDHTSYGASFWADDPYRRFNDDDEYRNQYPMVRNNRSHEGYHETGYDPGLPYNMQGETPLVQPYSPERESSRGHSGHQRKQAASLERPSYHKAFPPMVLRTGSTSYQNDHQLPYLGEHQQSFDDDIGLENQDVGRQRRSYVGGGKDNPVFESDDPFNESGGSSIAQGSSFRRRRVPSIEDASLHSSTHSKQMKQPSSALLKKIKESESKLVLSEVQNVEEAAARLGVHTIRGVRKLREFKEAMDRQRHLTPVQETQGDVCGDPQGRGDRISAETTGLQRPLSRQLSGLWRSQLLATSPRAPLKGVNKWKYHRSREWKRTKRSIREFFNTFNIWQSSFKTIEGNFGSSVVSYFQFLKWLFLLNIFTCVCVLGGLVLPQAFMAPKTFNQTLYMGNTAGELSMYQEVAADCSMNYTQTVRVNTDSKVSSRILDVIQGTGFMENTYLFVGFYFNKTQLYLDSAPLYNMPLAYLLITAGYLIVTLILMVRYTADGVKEKLISKGDRFYKASSMVFCGWDYNLTQGKASTYKHQSLYQEFGRELTKQYRDEEWRKMSAVSKGRIYFVRVLINLLTLVILTGCAALIYFTVEVWKPELLETSTVQDSAVLTLGVEFLPSLTLTALNLIFPLLFQKIVLAEKYTPGVELKITIIRTVFLRLASLVVLAVTLLRLITCSEEDRHCGNCSRIYCWETYVGQELYKLVILDFFVVVATTFLVEFPRKLIVKRVKKLEFFHQEFDLPVNVLNIVYAQTLCWWGAFYCPLIPPITMVKLLIFFYCKKVSLLVNQLPPSRPYRASKSNHFFMIILMISFTLSALAIAYSVGKIPPSQGCSPFRIYSRSDYLMFHSLSDAVATLPTIVQELFYFLASWVFYLILMVVLVLCIYYYTAKTSGSKKVVELLKEQLALVETDKQFLLRRVNSALQQGGLSR